MKQLISNFQKLSIYKDIPIAICLAPLQVATMKLWNEYLTAGLMSLVIAIPSIYGMLSVQLNKLSIKTLFRVEVGVNLVYFIIGLVFLMFNLPYMWLIITSPILGGLEFACDSAGERKVCNKFKQEIELDNFYAKASSIGSGAYLLGQGVSAGFYFLFNPDFKLVWMVCLFIGCFLFGITHVLKWRILSKLNVL